MSSVGSKLNREKRRREATYRRGYEDGVAARNAVPSDAQPVAWLRHGEETFVQNVPFGAMWISNKEDPHAFPVFERAQQPAPSVAVKALDDLVLPIAGTLFVERGAASARAYQEMVPHGDGYFYLVKIEDVAKALEPFRSALSAQVQDVACQTCNGTGKEARHQICRDCDETAPSVAVKALQAIANYRHHSRLDSDENAEAMEQIARSALSAQVQEENEIVDCLAARMRTVTELPMTAFANLAPQRDEFKGEQTILTYNDRVGIWDLAFFESGEDFPEIWFGDTHWIDITGMWPGVIAQVASFLTMEVKP